MYTYIAAAICTVLNFCLGGIAHWIASSAGIGGDAATPLTLYIPLYLTYFAFTLLMLGIWSGEFEYRAEVWLDRRD